MRSDNNQAARQGLNLTPCSSPRGRPWATINLSRSGKRGYSISSVDDSIVLVGADDRGLHAVIEDLFRYATKIGERIDMTAEHRRKFLIRAVPALTCIPETGPWNVRKFSFS